MIIENHYLDQGKSFKELSSVCLARSTLIWYVLRVNLCSVIT